MSVQCSVLYDVMLQDAGMNEDHLQMLQLSGLVHQGKLAEVTKRSECHCCRVFVIIKNY